MSRENTSNEQGKHIQKANHPMNAHNSLGTRPNKRLGQHFLKDGRIIGRILAASGIGKTDTVLEIGPGKGALTLPLSLRAARVVAVEKDRELAAFLESKLRDRGMDHVEVINEDILSFDLKPWVPDEGSLIALGNLPYNISTPFLRKLVEHQRVVTRAILMFQWEVAQRLVASPGTRAYGAMTVLVGYHATCTPLLEVSSQAFYPRPRVQSMVVEIDFQRPFPRRAKDEALFKKLVRGAFSQRRKTLLNSLCGAFPNAGRGDWESCLKAAGVDPGTRAETLPIEAFLDLVDAVVVDKLNTG